MLPNKNLQHFATCLPLSRCLPHSSTLSLFPSLSVCLLCLLLPPPPDVVANAVPLRFARPKLFPLIAAIMRCSRSRYLPLPRSLSLPSCSPSSSCLLSWALAEPQPDRATLLHSILRFDRAKITWGERRRAEERRERESRREGQQGVGVGSCNVHDMRRLSRSIL